MKVGRNEVCPCGSNRKYKKCCIVRPESKVEGCVVDLDLDPEARRRRKAYLTALLALAIDHHS